MRYIWAGLQLCMCCHSVAGAWQGRVLPLLCTRGYVHLGGWVCGGQ